MNLLHNRMISSCKSSRHIWHLGATRQTQMLWIGRVQFFKCVFICIYASCFIPERVQNLIYVFSFLMPELFTWLGNLVVNFLVNIRKCVKFDVYNQYCSVLATCSFQRSRLQQICSQYFEWPPEKTGQFFFPLTYLVMHTICAHAWMCCAYWYKIFMHASCGFCGFLFLGSCNALIQLGSWSIVKTIYNLAPS